MAENNVNQQPVQVETQVAAKPKKRIRVGFIFFALVPLYAIISIQTITQVPFLFVAMNDIAKNGNSADAMDMTKALEVFNEKYAFFAYLLYAVVGVIAFGLWYYFGFVRRGTKVSLKEIHSGFRRNGDRPSVPYHGRLCSGYRVLPESHRRLYQADE